MRVALRVVLAFVLLAVGSATAAGPATTQPTPAAYAPLATLTWTSLPPLPDPLGFAGPYAGVSNGALLVAGGANFPEGPPWEGHPKVWHDRIFVLERPDGQWRQADDTLPRALG